VQNYVTYDEGVQKMSRSVCCGFDCKIWTDTKNTQLYITDNHQKKEREAEEESLSHTWRQHYLYHLLLLTLHTHKDGDSVLEERVNSLWFVCCCFEEEWGFKKQHWSFL
jgi:hypothetical protein